MSSPAGIGIRNADGTISFTVVADNGWIKEGIGEVLNRDFPTRAKAEALILTGPMPGRFLVLSGSLPAVAYDETDFLRKLVCFPRCMITYAYLWAENGWTFRRIDGSDSILLTEAILLGIED